MIDKNYTIVFIIVSLVFICSCCMPKSEGISSGQCDEWIKTFFQLPIKEQQAQFVKFDIEKQYAIYLCGNQAIHPPAMYLDEPFAKQGEKIVGFLKTKLSQANDDLTIRDIIAVFCEMNILRTYNVVGDADLMKTILDSIEKMKNDDWKKVVKEMVQRNIDGKETS